MPEPLPAEEAGRAGVYALLARLLTAPPDEALLEAIASADDIEADDRRLADPWLELTWAASSTDARSLRVEYERAAAGRGKARFRRASGACDRLRAAIADHHVSVPAQREFFSRRIAPAQRCCESLAETSGSRFYRHVGRFASAFFQLEHEAFALPDDTN
jgi:TorA maturation chaperone TorD